VQIISGDKMRVHWILSR